MPASTVSGSPFRGYRFQPEIIAHAVWLYHRFSLSHRDVEECSPNVASRSATRRSDCGAADSAQCCQASFVGAIPRRGDKLFLDEVALPLRLGLLRPDLTL
jgi:putative transposase